jgi:hypothetical protein
MPRKKTHAAEPSALTYAQALEIYARACGERPGASVSAEDARRAIERLLAEDDDGDEPPITPEEEIARLRKRLHASEVARRIDNDKVAFLFQFVKDDELLSSRLPPVTEIDLKILRYLDSVYPVTTLQIDLEEAIRVSHRTIGPALEQLRRWGFVCQPRGERHGEGITDRGRIFLRDLDERLNGTSH